MTDKEIEPYFNPERDFGYGSDKAPGSAGGIGRRHLSLSGSLAWDLFKIRVTTTPGTRVFGTDDRGKVRYKATPLHKQIDDAVEAVKYFITRCDEEGWATLTMSVEEREVACRIAEASKRDKK